MATKAEELDVDGVKVRFTNPDKVYFPKLGSGGTKGKVVEYYRSVATGGQERSDPGIGRGALLTRCATAPPICSGSPTASRVRRSTRSGCPRSIPTICTPAG